MALLLALAACGPTPAVNEPVESEEVAEVTPAPPATSEPDNPTPAPAGDTAPDDGNGRPASITLTLTGTSTKSDGTYAATGPARFCGNAVFNFTGNTKAFNFEFPDDLIDREIKDVTFGAEDLLPGSSTSLFSIGVSVKAKLGGEPPATVVHPDQPGSGHTGSAQRSESGGTTTVHVEGTNDFGESIILDATCGPR